MKRTYLEEDVQLIQKYFPGAKAVAIRTPFDLNDGKAGGSRGGRFLQPEAAYRPHKQDRWFGDVQWNQA